MQTYGKITAGIIVLALALLVGQQQSAEAIIVNEPPHVDYFLHIDGIEGESTDQQHPNEIEMESFSWGELNPQIGQGAGKVQLQDFHFVAKTSKASPKLMLYAASGKHIPEAVITLRKAGSDQQDYIKIKLSEVIVTGYSINGTGSIPEDHFDLSFAKIEFEYKPQSADGSLNTTVRAAYDFKTNKVQ
jgi:type VI secretion system secreted protein Hcp